MLLQIPGVLSSSQIETILKELHGVPFEDGRKTASAGAQAAKRNLQLPQDGHAQKACAPLVLEALGRNPQFFSAALPQRISGPLFNRYDVGMCYGDHLDVAVAPGPATLRLDIACTLFLSAPDQYDGGELVIRDSFGAHRVKLPAGSMIVYPASSLHCVEPVTRGSRLAAVLWVQSLVREEGARQALFELDLVIGNLAKTPANSGDVQSLSRVYHNLLRMWAQS